MTSATVSEPRQLVGTPLVPTVLVIERGPVARFAEAVYDNSPVYQNPIAATDLGLSSIPIPPTYLFAAAHWAAFPEQQPPVPEGARTLADLVASLRVGGGIVLHGEQEFVYQSPVSVGDVLHATGFVEDVTTKESRNGGGGMTLMTVRTDYRDPHGDLRVTARSVFLHRP